MRTSYSIRSRKKNFTNKLENLLQNAASNTDAESDVSISDTIRNLYEKIRNVGFRNLPQGMSREMSLPRIVDIACVASRLRENR